MWGGQVEDVMYVGGGCVYMWVEDYVCGGGGGVEDVSK